MQINRDGKVDPALPKPEGCDYRPRAWYGADGENSRLSIFSPLAGYAGCPWIMDSKPEQL
jgi:hypothetical protein